VRLFRGLRLGTILRRRRIVDGGHRQAIATCFSPYHPGVIGVSVVISVGGEVLARRLAYGASTTRGVAWPPVYGYHQSVNDGLSVTSKLRWQVKLLCRGISIYLSTKVDAMALFGVCVCRHPIQ
jgi:hypothetical protein